MDTNNKHFGKALKIYMKRKRITIAGFAKDMGVYPKSIYDAFKVEQPRADTLKKYLALLNITEEELYGINDSTLSIVKEDSPIYKKEDPKKTIEIPVSDFEYFMSALKELDAFKAKELERQQQELEKLQEANRVNAHTVKQ
jgi:transcriptional regulator with XRE-family HTH domain